MRLPTNIYLFQSLFLLTTPTAAAIFARRLSEENQSHRLFNASDKCPCLAEDQLPESFFISHCTTTCDDLNSRCMTLDSNNGTGECVPMDYGLGRCEYWDNYSGFKRQECKKKPMEPWCKSAWCFVDEDNCERPNIERGNINRTTVNGMKLMTSYETCGNVDTYSESKVLEDINGKHLRVTFPGDSSDGYTLLTDPNDSSNKLGSMRDLMLGADGVDGLEDLHNFTWEVRPISDNSLKRYSSSYTACVHEVALNETDMCIGAFWTTSERLLLTPFTTVIYSDSFYMVSFKDSKTDFLDTFLTPLAPFENDAWMWLCFVVLYMAGAVNLVQTFDERMEEDDSTGEEDRNYVTRMKKIGCRMGDNVFYGVTSMAKGEVTSESEEPSVAEKIIIAGFMLFALIVLTAYTASSAAALVVDNAGAKFDNLDAILSSPTANLCIENAIADMFTKINTAFNNTSKLVNKTNVAEMLEAMDDGDCVACVMKQDALDFIMATDDDHCDKLRAGEVLLTIGNAYPVSDFYATALTYASGKAVNEGKYEPLRDRAKQKYVGSSKCGGDDEDSEFEKLGTSELLAPLLITAGCTSIGLLVFFWPTFMGLIRKQEVDKIKKTSATTDAGTIDTLGGDLEHDAALREFLQKLTVTQLLRRADANSKINLADLKTACAALPDKDPLVTLIYSKECSATSINMAALAKLPTLALLEMLPAMTLDEANLVARDKEELRKILIHRISELPDFKSQGLSTARQSKSNNVTSGITVETTSLRLAASASEILDVIQSSQTSLDANVVQLVNNKAVKSSHTSANVFVYLSCDDTPNMACQIQTDFTSTNPGSTLSIKKGSMKPSNSSSHDEAISVLQIELTDSNAIGPLVIFFLRHHESTKVDSNDSYSSFVLTHDRNHAKLAKEAVREVNKRFSSRNEEQQARTFVGRAGFFEETQSRSGDDDIGGGYSISA